jgi:hypothetical protein
MLSPGVIVIIGAAGALGAVGSYTIVNIAQRVGPKIELGDLLPLAPWEGPPIPRAVKTKPELPQQVIDSL